MKEIWKDICFIENDIEWNFKGLYQVSNLGNVKSLNYNKTGKEKILSLSEDKRGYKRVRLYLSNNKKKIFLVHRLVAYMFISNPNNYKYVNHKDENPSNNCVENLEWCTHKYNMNYGTRNERISNNHKDENNPNYGKHFSEETRQKMSESAKNREVTDEARMKLSATNSGKNHPLAKRVAQYDKEGNLIKIWDYAKQISKELNINYITLHDYLSGKRKTHEYKGFIWKYIEEDDTND